MSPQWSSKLMEFLTSPRVPARAPAEEFERILMGGLRQGAFKPEELEWSGGLMRELVGASKGKKLTKQELIEKLDAGSVKVEERVFGGPPVRNAKDFYAKNNPDKSWDALSQSEKEDWQSAFIDNKMYDQPKWSTHTLPGGQNYRELVMTLPMEEVEGPFMMGGKEIGKTTKPAFTHSHWEGVENPLLHIRFDERVAPDGKRTLFVHELQSDWHQQGKRAGYAGKPDVVDNIYAKYGLTPHRNPDGSLSVKSEHQLKQAASSEDISAVEHWLDNLGSHPPDAPFKKSWLQLGMKRLLSWAKENGFERIAWPGTGEQIAAIEGKSSPQLERHYFETMKNTMNEIMKPYRGRVEQSTIDKVPYLTPTAQVAQDDILQATEYAAAQGVKAKGVSKSKQPVYSVDLTPETPSKWPLFAIPAAATGGLASVLGPESAEAGIIPPSPFNPGQVQRMRGVVKPTEPFVNPRLSLPESGKVSQPIDVNVSGLNMPQASLGASKYAIPGMAGAAGAGLMVAHGENKGDIVEMSPDEAAQFNAQSEVVEMSEEDAAKFNAIQPMTEGGPTTGGVPSAVNMEGVKAVANPVMKALQVMEPTMQLFNFSPFVSEPIKMLANAPSQLGITGGPPPFPGVKDPGAMYLQNISDSVRRDMGQEVPQSESSFGPIMDALWSVGKEGPRKAPEALSFAADMATGMIPPGAVVGGLSKMYQASNARRIMPVAEKMGALQMANVIKDIKGTRGASMFDAAEGALKFHSDTGEQIPRVLSEKVSRMVDDKFFSNQDLIDAAQDVFKNVPEEKRPKVLQFKGDKLEVNVNVKELISQMTDEQVQKMTTGALLGKTGPKGVLLRRTPPSTAASWDYVRDVEKVALNHEQRFGIHSMAYKPIADAYDEAKLAKVAYAGHFHDRVIDEMGKFPTPLEQDNVGKFMIARRQREGGREVTVDTTLGPPLTARENKLVEIIDDELNKGWDAREVVRAPLGLKEINQDMDYFPFVGGEKIKQFSNVELLPKELEPFFTHAAGELAMPKVDNPIEALMIRMNSQINEMYMNPALKRAAQRINALPSDAAELKGFMTHFVQRMVNIPTAADIKIAHMINKSGSTLTGQEVADTARRLIDISYQGAMAFRPWLAMRNLMQPVLTTAPELGNTWTARATAKAMSRDPNIKPWMEKMGYYQEHVVPEVYKSIEGELDKKGLGAAFKKAGMWMYHEADRGTRTITAIAANDKFDWALKKSRGNMQDFERLSGVRSLDDGIKNQVSAALKAGDAEGAKDVFIKEMLRKTQFIYTKPHSALFGQSHGIVGRSTMQWHTFPVNYADMMVDFMTKGTLGDRTKKMGTWAANSALLYGLLTEGIGMDPVAAGTTVALGPLAGMGAQILIPSVLKPLWTFGTSLAQSVPEDVAEQGTSASVMYKGKRGLDRMLRDSVALIPGGASARDIYTGGVEIPSKYNTSLMQDLLMMGGFPEAEGVKQRRAIRREGAEEWKQ